LFDDSGLLGCFTLLNGVYSGDNLEFLVCELGQAVQEV